MASSFFFLETALLMAPYSTSNLFLLSICRNTERCTPPPHPAGLLARLRVWPKPGARMSAPLHPCHFVFSFEESALCVVAAAPWAWKGPALPHGLGDTCLLPLCWPGPRWGRGTGQCSLSCQTQIRGSGDTS